MNLDTPSPEYLAALKASNEASRTFNRVRDAYRAQRIGDEEFLRARAAYVASEAAFDKAFAEEQARSEREANA